MTERASRITAEISAVIERNLRLELLHEREAMLRRELESVRAELGRLDTRRPTPRPAGKPAPVARPAPVSVMQKRPMRGDSARSMMHEILQRAHRPMTTAELTKALLRRGWKSNRANPAESVDAALRNNPADFRRTAPNTFETKK